MTITCSLKANRIVQTKIKLLKAFGDGLMRSNEDY